MADFQAIGSAAIDGDDRKRSGFTDLAQAAVDRHHTALEECCRRVRRIIDRLRHGSSHQLVAGADFLHRAREHHRCRIAGTRDPRGAEIDRLVSKRLVGVRIDQRVTAPVHVPAFLYRTRDASHISRVPAESNTLSRWVATIVGALSSPSGSITSGRVRNGSITDAGMLGISSGGSGSARTRGLSFTPAPVAGAAPGRVTGSVPGRAIVRLPFARSSRITYPG